MAAALVVSDPVYLPIFERIELELAAHEAIPTDVSLASGAATKVAGAASRHLTQGLALTVGKTMRCAYVVTSWTGTGSIRMRCLGTVNAEALIASAARAYQRAD